MIITPCSSPNLETYLNLLTAAIVAISIFLMRLTLLVKILQGTGGNLSPTSSSDESQSELPSPKKED